MFGILNMMNFYNTPPAAFNINGANGLRQMTNTTCTGGVLYFQHAAELLQNGATTPFIFFPAYPLAAQGLPVSAQKSRRYAARMARHLQVSLQREYPGKTRARHSARWEDRYSLHAWPGGPRAVKALCKSSQAPVTPAWGTGLGACAARFR